MLRESAMLAVAVGGEFLSCCRGPVNEWCRRKGPSFGEGLAEPCGWVGG